MIILWLFALFFCDYLITIIHLQLQAENSKTPKKRPKNKLFQDTQVQKKIWSLKKSRSDAKPASRWAVINSFIPAGTLFLERTGGGVEPM